MRYQITKNWAGKTLVKFACGKCGAKLSEQIERAGKQDVCPACGIIIVIPGRKELEKRRAAAIQKKQEAEKTKALEEEQKKARLAEAASNNFSPSINQADSSGSSVADFGNLNVGGEGTNAGRSEAGEDSGWIGPINPAEYQSAEQEPSTSQERWAPEPIQSTDVPPAPQDNTEPVTPPTGTTRRPSTRSNKWWRDSITFGDIRETRYPALMAYRNLMVLAWRIFTICVCIALLIVPCFFMYKYLSEYTANVGRFDKNIIAMNASPIESALATIRNGTQLNANAQSALRDALNKTNYDTPTFLYGDLLEQEEASRFFNSYTSWRTAQIDQINERKPSLITTLAFSIGTTLVYWVILVAFAILYTILLLVPPECIKLAIDVEQGIRTMNEPPA